MDRQLTSSALVLARDFGISCRSLAMAGFRPAQRRLRSATPLYRFGFFRGLTEPSDMTVRFCISTYKNTILRSVIPLSKKFFTTVYGAQPVLTVAKIMNLYIHLQNGPIALRRTVVQNFFDNGLSELKIVFL